MDWKMCDVESLEAWRLRQKVSIVQRREPKNKVVTQKN